VARNLFAEDQQAPSKPGRNLFPDLKQQAENNQSFVGGASQSLLQGATLGFSDEIQSFIAAAVAAPFISDKTFSQLMVDARTSFREENEQFKEENPKTALGLEIAGGLATGGLAAGGKVAAAKTVGGAIIQGAKTGAAIGTAAGAGFADEEDFLSQETLEEAVKTGTISAVLGGVTPIAIKEAVSAGKLIPKAFPESLMETAIKIRPSIPQAKRANMIRTALDEGILPNTKGLELISKKLVNLDSGLNRIIDRATEKGLMISKKALFTELGKLRKDLGGVNLRAAKNERQINQIAKAFDVQLKKISKAKLTPREVQDLKRSAYQQLKFDVSRQSASFAQTEAEKGIIRGARKSLESIDPSVAKINKREGNLLQLGDELERAVGRLDNRNLISLDTGVKVAAGAATGSPMGTAAGVAASTLGAPRVKARTALALENIRVLGETMKQVNKSLPPEAAAAFSILVEDNKEQLNDLIDD